MQLSWLLPITCSKLSDFFDRENSKSLFKEISWDKAFKVIEMELGFMYVVLHTKAAVIHSPKATLNHFLFHQYCIRTLLSHLEA